MHEQIESRFFDPQNASKLLRLKGQKYPNTTVSKEVVEGVEDHLWVSDSSLLTNVVYRVMT